ncbi:GNAT family N-acetyltransferase [Roseobacter sp. YSTF-M11]|uniref:GNAT family N-acetyltransferase n=1 Tax=Roseobacter insulae TaxID=2859783 RepID=A0A9X1FSU2_9RHOB|nr:GNAT family N-acetyltransferase [Roseobacter insulae]MBW4706946.1 GNAT family N-acetyltransferase [Roseobacter insulae]
MSVRIERTDDTEACLALRRIVFIEEQGVAEAEEVDALDAEALHLLAQDDETPVGTARLVFKGDTVKIGRVCVLKSHRGTGLGASLIRAALDVARSVPGVSRAQLGAQLHALPFYRKLGFAAYGPTYDDAGIAHRDMEQPL